MENIIPVEFLGEDSGKPQPATAFESSRGWTRPEEEESLILPIEMEKKSIRNDCHFNQENTQSPEDLVLCAVMRSCFKEMKPPANFSSWRLEFPTHSGDCVALSLNQSGNFQAATSFSAAVAIAWELKIFIQELTGSPRTAR